MSDELRSQIEAEVESHKVLLIAAAIGIVVALAGLIFALTQVDDLTRFLGNAIGGQGEAGTDRGSW